jgi:hypothetical protein
MSLDPQLAATLTATIYIARQASVTASGTPTWGTATAYPARVELFQRLETDAQGQRMVTRNRVYFDSPAAIVQGDRLWLPGVATTSANARRIDEITQQPALPPATGTSHYEVVV